MKVASRRGLMGSIAVAALLVACSAPEEPNARIRQVSQQEMGAVASSALVLDVRTPDEYGKSHVPGAVNIPVDQLPARLQELNTQQPLVVYCESGRRAGAALEILSEAGFEDLSHLDGDMSAWRAAGLPVEP